MVRTRLLCAGVVGLLLAGFVLAGDAPVPLATAHGVVEKVEKESLTLRPRSADGKFQKNLTLKLTGTSKVTLVTLQKRAGKMVPVQKEIEPKELQPNQGLAVIYTPEKTGGVMLSAVAQSVKAP
jgi:hypothetical protein